MKTSAENKPIDIPNVNIRKISCPPRLSTRMAKGYMPTH